MATTPDVISPSHPSVGVPFGDKHDWGPLGPGKGAQVPSSGLSCFAAPAEGGMGWFRNSTRKGPWDAATGCMDWQKYQWEASFKDIPFAVQSDSRSGGRRIHVHEYPSKETWDNEDLGRLRQQVSVEGYVFGDQSDVWAEMLFATCTSPLSTKDPTGAGKLFLPFRVPMWAVCQTVEGTFNADQMGRIDFQMTFSIVPDRVDGFKFYGIPTALAKVKTAHDVSNAAAQVDAHALRHFDNKFTGTQPAVARNTAADYIRTIGRILHNTAQATRLNDTSNALVEFVAQRFIDHSDAYSDVQRTSLNTLNRTAAVLAQRTSGLSLYQQFMSGVAIRASTGEVLPAQGQMGEGFGGMLWNALAAMHSGLIRPADNADDLAQALIQMSNIKPRIQRTLSAQQLATASVQAELELAETVCALARRLALAHSVMAAVLVAPSKQPNASITRTRLLEQIDEEIELVPANNNLQDALRRLRSGVVAFVNHYSVNGGASITLPASWAGKPLAVIAASVYGSTAAGRDLDLMRFNGITHPMFAPSQMVALNDGKMLLSSGL